MAARVHDDPRIAYRAALWKNKIRRTIACWATLSVSGWRLALGHACQKYVAVEDKACLVRILRGCIGSDGGCGDRRPFCAKDGLAATRGELSWWRWWG